LHCFRRSEEYLRLFRSRNKKSVRESELIGSIPENSFSLLALTCHAWIGTGYAPTTVGGQPMFISVAILVFTGVLAFGALFLIWRAASVYFKFRGTRLVACPKTGEAAGVEVNAKRAAISGAEFPLSSLR
jgi:hypothetical protein